MYSNIFWSNINILVVNSMGNVTMLHSKITFIQFIKTSKDFNIFNHKSMTKKWTITYFQEFKVIGIFGIPVVFMYCI